MIILTTIEIKCWHTNHMYATLEKHQIQLDISQSLAVFDCKINVLVSNRLCQW